MTAPRLRLATEEDGRALAGIYAPAVEGSATSFELEPPTRYQMGERVVRLTRRTPWLVAEDGREVLGYAYAGPHRERPAYKWSVDVSAYVAAHAHRTGVGRALYTALFDVLRLQGFRNAYAGVTLPNAASEAFHRAMGFEPVGVYRRVGYKLGRWHDVAWGALALGAHEPEPAPPLPLSAVADSDRYREALRDAARLIRRPSATVTEDR